MKTWVIVAITILLTVVGITIFATAWSVRSAPKPSFAMGFYEEKNVWNRIRVDAKGRVQCAP